MNNPESELNKILSTQSDLKSKLKKACKLIEKTISLDLGLAQKMCLRVDRLIPDSEEFTAFRGMSLDLHGQIEFVQAEYSRALSFFTQALSLFEKIDAREQCANSLFKIGASLAELYDFSNALTYLFEAEKILSEIKFYGAICRIQGVVAKIYSSSGQAEKAHKTYSMVLELIEEYIQEESARSREQIFVLNNLASEQINLDMLAESRISIARAMKLLEQHPNQRAKAALLINLAKLHQRENQFEGVSENLSEALEIARSFGFKNLESAAVLEMGRFALQKKEFVRALAYAKQAELIATEINSVPQRSVAKKLLSEIYEKQGDLKSALTHYKAYHDIEVERMEMQSDNRWKALDIIHETEKMKQKSRILQEKNMELKREIVARKKAEAELRDSLKEKELLLREIHHRVKNNLAVVTGLLDLQTTTIEDPGVLEKFTECRNRVKSMSLIHTQLYQSDNLTIIDFTDYVDTLSSDLAQLFGEGRPIRIRNEIDSVQLPLDTAIPLGLIINELVTNAFKYAFPNGTQGSIRIAMQHVPEKRIELIVQDNGIGLPENIDLDDLDSLGLQLVVNLTEQIDGNLEAGNKNGAIFRITFPDSNNH